MSARYVVGTSGFTYKDWKGVFYPADVPQKRWLEYYSTQFPAVEINNTFYRLPAEETVRTWRERVPEGFLFAVKASRPITHYQRLQNVEEPLSLFLQRATLLEDKLGPILFQLPPSLRKDGDLLRGFLDLLPHGFQYVIEFRHPSWYQTDIYEMLSKDDVALCIHDMRGQESPLELTAKNSYVRFHGTEGRYVGGYPTQRLRTWAQRLRALATDRLSCVYVFFNNDVGGHAVSNALTMTGLLKEQE